MGKDTDLGISVCQTRLQNPRRWRKKQDAGSLGPQMAEWYSVPLILDCSGRKREVTMKASCCPFVMALDLEFACAQRMRKSTVCWGSPCEENVEELAGDGGKGTTQPEGGDELSKSRTDLVFEL